MQLKSFFNPSSVTFLPPKFIEEFREMVASISWSMFLTHQMFHRSNYGVFARSVEHCQWNSTLSLVGDSSVKHTNSILAITQNLHKRREKRLGIFIHYKSSTQIRKYEDKQKIPNNPQTERKGKEAEWGSHYSFIHTRTTLPLSTKEVVFNRLDNSIFVFFIKEILE